MLEQYLLLNMVKCHQRADLYSTLKNSLQINSINLALNIWGIDIVKGGLPGSMCSSTANRIPEPSDVATDQQNVTAANPNSANTELDNVNSTYK